MQQKNSSNPVKLRSRGEGKGEIARWRRDRAKARLSGAVLQSTSGAVLQSKSGGAAIDDRRGAIVGLELGLWLSDWSSGFAGEVSSSSLFAIWALSLSLSLSLSFRKCFEVKIGTENNFQGPSLIFTIN